MNIADITFDQNDLGRPDLQCARQELAVAILQTFLAPTDHKDWYRLYREPPDKAEIEKRLAPVNKYFALLDPEGPAFMQDLTLEGGEPKPIASLLIDTPGGKTLKDNLDHFVKRGGYSAVCHRCCMIMLYALQSYAPSGGVGHRTGLRGGGPLTTLVEPPEVGATDWQKLWINVLPQSSLQDAYGREYAGTEPGDWTRILPWLQPTRTSERKGSEWYPADIHALHLLWAMPRRIRLDAETLKAGECQSCGCHSEQLITQYKTKNYGNNYDDSCLHPLSPYRTDKKGLRYAIKGKEGGLTYQDWLGISMQNQTPEAEGVSPALVVRDYATKADDYFQQAAFKASLWCFGFDMDNMKARSFYCQRFPLIHLDEVQLDDFHSVVETWLRAAFSAQNALRTYVKEAWFRYAKSVKGTLSQVSAHFWQQTDTAFFAKVAELAEQISRDGAAQSLNVAWWKLLQHHCLKQFDQWALDGPAQDKDMKRIVGAKNKLIKTLNSDKNLKTIKGDRDGQDIPKGV
ncbi:type I-E CRISPR-associated protein Cse1/CasA [Exilibacterium tricleocarpae]|uniref:type I-E CRISPR-associated protein Cse1/CasA n=1 Tax=Exilibacterium tricleocarpae TaxID=2591008 RepID=UPI0015D0EA3C|nr:type I-E CRISPR-associated protein Cse1/CasA [Exilibacterium tricleocarpae]